MAAVLEYDSAGLVKDAAGWDVLHDVGGALHIMLELSGA